MYHAWWPGSDPIYAHNQDENRERIFYYDIVSVPSYLLDGTNYGTFGNPQAMAANMDQRLAQPAPVRISIETDITADSVRATVTLVGLASFTQDQLYLRTAIVERMVTYATAPGSNGETVFPDVMRKMLPDAQGLFVPSLAPGDTLRFTFHAPVHAEWTWTDLAVVAWLQSDKTKETIQSNISLPTYCLSSSDAPADVLTANQTISKTYWLCNETPETLHLRIVKELIHDPQGWVQTLTIGQQTADSLDLTVPPADTLAFTLVVQTDAHPGWITLNITARNLNDPYGYGFSRRY